MSDIFDLGIIGMGPAGIGAAMSLHNTNLIRNSICFEKGGFTSIKDCLIQAGANCTESKSCNIISGIGGASAISSGKISAFPAGSGLLNFFNSEEDLIKNINDLILILSDYIRLEKIEIDDTTKKSTELSYQNNNIQYKFYDVYKFNNRDYLAFINKIIYQLKEEGMQLYINSEVIGLKFEEDNNCYNIKVKMPQGEKLFYVRKLIIATGALDIDNKLLEGVSNLPEINYEIGVRIEMPARIFQKLTSAHGDLKLKYKNGRTYCTTQNGYIITYQTAKMHFLEGYVDLDHPSNYGNLAVLIRRSGYKELHSFFERYLSAFNGMPVKQKYIDYLNYQKNPIDFYCSLDVACNADINTLYNENLNDEIKSFINKVLIESSDIPKEQMTIVAPELKILRSLPLNQDFMIKNNLFIIGAATGKFRGILQSLCSGLKCGKFIVESDY